MRARLAIDTTQSGGSSEPDMKAFAVMPRTSLAVAGRDHGHAAREAAHDPAEMARVDLGSVRRDPCQRCLTAAAGMAMARIKLGAAQHVVAELARDR